MEMAKNTPATINVNLKTKFSSPRRLKLAAPPPPQDRPNPVPLTCKSTKVDRSTAAMVCMSKINVCMSVLYHGLLFRKPTEKPGHAGNKKRECQIGEDAFVVIYSWQIHIV